MTSDEQKSSNSNNNNNNNSNDNTNSTNKKKFIVISGITSGIGAGMLKQFTKMGHLVAGFGRRKEKIELLIKTLNIDINKHPHLLAVVDITDQTALQNWCTLMLNTYGSPDILIHNAGSVVGCNKNTWDLDLKLVQQSFDIHVKGALLLCKYFVPAMMKSSKIKTDGNGSNILIVTSWAGKNGYAEGTPYVSGKFALEGLVQCMAQELADTNPEMCCCAVSPGFVNTDMLKGSFSATAATQMNVENGDEWGVKCCDWLLSINSKMNGKSIAPPLEKESMQKYCQFFKQYGINMEVNDYTHDSK